MQLEGSWVFPLPPVIGQSLGVEDAGECKLPGVSRSLDLRDNFQVWYELLGAKGH